MDIQSILPFFLIFLFIVVVSVLIKGKVTADAKYDSREVLLTPAELSFYKVLVEAVPEGLYITSKVRISPIAHRLVAYGFVVFIVLKYASAMNAIAIALHVVAAVVWVGGLFFAYIVLRPSALSLEPPQRLQLWAGVFKRFFPWVWMSIIILVLSGYWLIFNWFKGFASTPGYVHLMHIMGWVMFILFFYLYYKIYPSFKVAIEAQDWPAGAAALNRIRQIVLINLILGLALVILVAALQRLG